MDTIKKYISNAQSYLDTVNLDEVVPIFILISLAFSVMLIFYIIKKEKKRAGEVKRAISILGFVADDVSSVTKITDLSNFTLFNSGRSKKIINLHNGNVDGCDASFMEYKYTTGSGKNSSTHRQTVLIVESEKLSMPAFTLAPEHFFHKIISAMGYQDIDFDGHELFSKKYLLRGKDEPAIRSFFNPYRIKFFEDHLGLNIQADGNRLLVYTPNMLVKPDHIRDFIYKGAEITGALKG